MRFKEPQSESDRTKLCFTKAIEDEKFENPLEAALCVVREERWEVKEHVLPRKC